MLRTCVGGAERTAFEGVSCYFQKGNDKLLNGSNAVSGKVATLLEDMASLVQVGMVTTGALNTKLKQKRGTMTSTKSSSGTLEKELKYIPNKKGKMTTLNSCENDSMCVINPCHADVPGCCCACGMQCRSCCECGKSCLQS